MTMAVIQQGKQYELLGWPGVTLELTDDGLKIMREGSRIVEWPLAAVGGLANDTLMQRPSVEDADDDDK